MNTDELKAKALELDIEIEADATDEAIQAKIDEKTGATQAPGAQTPAPEVPFEEGATDAEITELADKVRAKIEEKKSVQPMYTQEQVDDMLTKFARKFDQRRNDDDDEDYIDLLDNKKMPECIRLGRLKGKDGEYKFVVGLKNMNTDPYINGEITVMNIENPTKKGEFIPWSEFILEDGETILYPYLSFMKNMNCVWAEVLDRKEDDVSEKFGTVDVKIPDEENEWSQKSTGKRVLAKAYKVKTTYHCKDIKTGKLLSVSDDVVNKGEASYADLKKYLEAK